MAWGVSFCAAAAVAAPTTPSFPPPVLGCLFAVRSAFFMHSNHPLHFNLIAAAHASMIEHGFQPDFPPGTDTELARHSDAARRPSRRRPHRPAQPALVLHRQRHLKGSRPDRMGRAVARRPHSRAGGRGRRGCARQQGHACIDKHAQIETTSVYTGVTVFPMLPTAALRGHYFAQRKSRPRCHRHRIRR